MEQKKNLSDFWFDYCLVYSFLLGFKDVGQSLGSQMGNFTINN